MSVTAGRQFAPLYFYLVVAVCLCVAAADDGFTVGVILLLLLSGLLSWGLLEYGLHRFVFHYEARSELGRKLLYAAHLSHHENPESTNRIFASLVMSVPIATVYWLLAWAATGSWRVGSYLFVGLAAGYFYYEWIHFHFHHGRPRLRFLRYLRKYHLLHHHQTPDLRFGVTSPLFDLVFGTFRPLGKRAN